MGYKPKLFLMENSQKLIARYKHMLLKGRPSTANNESLENVSAGSMDMTIPQKVGDTREKLYHIIDCYLGSKPGLKDIADELVKRGERGLRYLEAEDGSRLAQDRDSLQGLEAIIRTDGSRPSFLVVNGKVDLASSPRGNWGDLIYTEGDTIETCVAAVGRINVPGLPGGFAGTGFLVHKDYIMTNRHVLQLIAKRGADRQWKVKRGAKIDFGHEFGGRTSLFPRPLKAVVFAVDKDIDINGPINHAAVDLVLLELAPGDMQLSPFLLDFEGGLLERDVEVFTIGYPARPPLGHYEPTLLEQLFQDTYGCKRLAPGIVIPSEISQEPWTVAHDATTLGGNSGSVVICTGNGTTASAIHYGGRRGEPKENWAHKLELMMELKDGLSGKPLRDIIQSWSAG